MLDYLGCQVDVSPERAAINPTFTPPSPFPPNHNPSCTSSIHPNTVWVASLRIIAIFLGLSCMIFSTASGRHSCKIHRRQTASSSPSPEGIPEQECHYLLLPYGKTWKNFVRKLRTHEL